MDKGYFIKFDDNSKELKTYNEHLKILKENEKVRLLERILLQIPLNSKLYVGDYINFMIKIFIFIIHSNIFTR